MRRITKRIFCTALALSMALPQSVPVFAAEADANAAQDSGQTEVQSGEPAADQIVNLSAEQSGEQTGQTSGQSADAGNEKNIVINEIESNGDDRDWVEIYNKGQEAVDISGWYILDGDTKHNKNNVTPLTKNTILEPGKFYVFEEVKKGDTDPKDFDFGLGAPDEVNLYTGTDELVEKFSWSNHANGVLARVPDGTGALTEVAASTKGTSNNDAVVTTKPEYKGAVDWSGSDKVITLDEGKTMFKTDSSGLDFYNGKLYCINNKQGTFWVMDVKKDGSLDYANGFTQNGKNLAFAYDSANASNSNPDAEGITVDGNGLAYAAVERDNNKKDVNANWILQFDPWAAGTTVVDLRNGT